MAHARVAVEWDENTLDQYLARLRRKLREIGASVAIETTHGVGYALR